MPYPWRDPAEETMGLYPELVVHDGRQSGSITFGRTRVPIWSPQWQVVDLDDYMHPGDPVADWQEAGESFVRNLLDLRGEFARLLLVLADAERCDRKTGLFRPAWWETKRHRKRVGDQLRRCLAALEDQ